MRKQYSHEAWRGEGMFIKHTRSKDGPPVKGGHAEATFNSSFMCARHVSVSSGEIIKS